MAIATQEEFHAAVHNNVGAPSKKYETISHGKNTIRREVSKIHAADWATARVNLAGRTINIDVYINFQQNSLSASDFVNLRSLAMTGINRYWSHPLVLDGVQFATIVAVHDRTSKALGVDLYIETSNSYARSHNTGIIDASFIYNKGFFGGMKANADQDFMLVAAHEFGHSVLDYFGGTDLSWSHKQTTNVIFQNVKSSTPGYPATGDIDLMKYYDGYKHRVSDTDRYSRTYADAQDLRRLIWVCQISF